MADNIRLLMQLIRCEITGEIIDASQFSDFTDDEWKQLYSFSKRYDLVHLVADSLVINNVISEGEIKDKFKKQILLAGYRYQKMEYETEALKEVLNNSGVEFIILKGYIMRDLYPEPWMRTSCDIDILVHESNFEEAKAVIFKELNYEFSNIKNHDVEAVAPSDVHIELHFKLCDSNDERKYNRLLKNVWDYTEQKEEGSCERFLTREMFYYYHIAHMAKHFEEGGCGIRPFIDLWLLNNKLCCDQALKDKYLREGELEKFNEIVCDLSNAWFENGPQTSLLSKVESYILTGGTYGSVRMKIAATRKADESKLHYIISKIWIPFERLCLIYPKLKNRRILQPYYEVCRIFKIASNPIMKERLNDFRNSSDDDNAQTSKLMSELGLN